jgi:alkyldihydroxyacetonephosphate synthase
MTLAAEAGRGSPRGTGAVGMMRWWGWGEESKRLPLPGAALRMLRAELGEAVPDRHIALEGVAMPEPRPLPDEIVDAVNRASVLTSHEHRLRRAAGRGYPDLVRLRMGQLEAAPDAVVLPGSAEQVGRALEVCSRHGIAVIPFGGGTSVVGGVEPLAGPHRAAIAMDLRRLRGVEVDRASLTATIGAGLRGPEVEAALRADGLTLGHFPQSFEYATIGGFAATRSAGQASSGYGRFDEMVTSLRLVAPTGELATISTPHSAAGPALRELILGSEGTLGGITEVTVRVRPAPPSRRYEGWMARSFEQGLEAVRALAQRDAVPDVVRLSDEEETRVSLALSGASAASSALLGAYLRARRRRRGCLAIVGWEAEADVVARRRSLSGVVLRSFRLAPLGPRPGRAWERRRFEGPYLRDELMDHGYLVETLETAHTWSRLGDLYAAVRTAVADALERQGTPGIVMCHVSHVYRDGASLYFTFLARRRPGEEIDQWRAVKLAACEAIVGAGGTITHHHGVGRDHAAFMPAEVGAVGIGALQAVKERLDPAGIMNPGKLLPGTS